MANNDSALFELLASRLEDDPEFVAWSLARYREYEGIRSWSELATRVGTTPPFLIQLALCKRPPSLTQDFATRVRQIAEFAAVDAAVLANLLRQVEFLHSLPSRGRFAATPNTLLAAARDRAESDEHPRDDSRGLGEGGNPDARQE
jgi:hypothetical protein